MRKMYFALCEGPAIRVERSIRGDERSKSIPNRGDPERAGESRDLIRHTGEEFVYVLKGCIKVVTEFYDPVILDMGESIYIDGNMGHAYLTAKSCDEATVLALSESYHDISSPEPRNLAGVSL